MKIGISTVHDSSNFGSFLQAYALQNVLQDVGHEVYFIRTRSRKYVRRIFYSGRRLLRNPASIGQYIRGRKKYLHFRAEQACFSEINRDQADLMDMVILGSDEIWNVTVPVFTYPVFYGIHIKAPIAAYAVSAGNASLKDIKNHPGLVKAIKKIPHILVRDDNTADIVASITGNTPTVVCDPTFLIDVERYKNPIADIQLPDCEYLLLYAYFIDDELRDNIIAFARERNLKIVSACFHHKWVDINLICGPLQFCSLISGSKFVITTTFHGTIFSILNHVRFLSFPTSLKTVDILKRLGLESRQIDKSTPLTEFSFKLESLDVDYATVDERIRLFREASMRQLDIILNS